MSVKLPHPPVFEIKPLGYKNKFRQHYERDIREPKYNRLLVTCGDEFHGLSNKPHHWKSMEEFLDDALNSSKVHVLDSTPIAHALEERGYKRYTFMTDTDDLLNHRYWYVKTRKEMLVFEVLNTYKNKSYLDGYWVHRYEYSYIYANKTAFVNTPGLEPTNDCYAVLEAVSKQVDEEEERIREMNRHKKFMCDFETFTADENTPEDERGNLETGVWLVASVELKDIENVVIHYSIEDWWEWVLKQAPSTFLFHNMGKFDGHFIFDYLLRSGYVHNPMVVDETTRTPVHNPHGNIISGSEQGFTVYTDLNPTEGDEGIAHNFMDSMDYLNSSVKDIGNSLENNYFKGDETPLVRFGTTIEETLHDRDGGVAGTDITWKAGDPWTMEQAVAYAKGDVQVVAAALNEINASALIDSGIFTQASLGYNAVLLEEDPGESIRVRERSNFRVRYPLNWSGMNPKPWTQVRAFSYYNGQNRLPDHKYEDGRVQTAKEWREMIKSGNFYIQLSYKGGFNWVNPRYQNEPLDRLGVSLDINSMYPWIYSTKPLPRYLASITSRRDMSCQGKALLRKVIDTGQECVVDFSELHIKIKPGFAPCIKASTKDNRYNKGAGNIAQHYQDEVHFTHGLPLTSVEVGYILDYYDIITADVDKIFWYELCHELMKKMRKHCKFWMSEKENSTGFRRVYAKLMLNTPYGKLGQYIREYNASTQVLDENGRVVAVDRWHEEGGRPHADVVTASFITAYGRVHLAETINKVGLDKFLYCDTDSLHMLWEGTHEELEEYLKERGVNVHRSHMGYWKIENWFNWAKFIKCKTYAEVIIEGDALERAQKKAAENGKPIPESVFVPVCAGFSKTDQFTKENFKIGEPFSDIRNVKVKGGALLMRRTSTIGPINEYQVDPRILDTIPG